jgi:hypothetical protein
LPDFSRFLPVTGKNSQDLPSPSYDGRSHGGYGNPASTPYHGVLIIMCTFPRLSILLTGVLAALICPAQPTIHTMRPDGTPNRAAWMAQGSFGMMTHYLIQPEGETPEARSAALNRIVDQFDLEGYLAQFDATGADWLIFTLMQGTGFLSSKCDSIAALDPNIVPRRDLMRELGQALEQRGKRLIVYMPHRDTGADPVVKSLLGLGTEGYAERHNAFLREYASGMGTLIDGWWFDSCRPQTDAEWQAEMDACRAGNPDAVVAFSGAEFCAGGGNIAPRCPIEDYHAGEIHLLEDGKIRTDFVYPPGEGNILVDEHQKLRKRGQEAGFYLPDSQFIDNVQWHGLLPIDLTFNPAVPNQYCHYTDKELFQFVDAIKAVGGALTINVPIENDNGHIPDDSHAQLVRLGRHLGAVR